MEWVCDPLTQASSLVSDPYRCTVRHTATGQWLAVISYAGHGADAYSFLTREEAQAWCEAQLAARRKPHP